MWRRPVKLRSLRIVLVMSVLVGGIAPTLGNDASAADETSEDVAVQKTAEQLHFKVPPDWPIEKRGGIMAPIPIEEYLARKFKALEASVQTLEQRVNGLDLRLRVLEEESKKQRQGLRSAEQTNHS